MYRNDWHQAHQRKTQRSAEIIADLMLNRFAIGSVLDIGCGHGDWLKAFADRGAPDIFGCDGPWTDVASLLIPRDRFKVQDFRQPLALDRRFDLVLSTEVGEHIEEQHARPFVRSIAAHGDLVLFGAAIPYQGGLHHVNEQWPSWWVGLFAAEGFRPFDAVRPLIWAERDVHFWYKQNALIYVREGRADLLERAEAAVRKAAMADQRLDIVHPDKFVELASYRSIAFKPLMRNFPRAARLKLRAMLTGNRPA
jgi:SAM-dependent methyltransferase